MAATRTDYSKIAARYDRTRARRTIAVDPVLQAVVDAASGIAPVSAIDVACGTGNYLAAQIDHGPAGVAWHGIDASPDMLAVARGKVAGATLTRALAEQIPYPDDAFDFAMVRWAFHHFQDKEAALDELTRIIKPGGSVHLEGGAADQRRGWWGYRYFPATERIDEARFWTADQVCEGLERRGFLVEMTVTRRRYRVPKSEVLFLAENRDLSQLAMLDDADYQLGLEEIRRHAPDPVLTDTAAMDVSGVLAV